MNTTTETKAQTALAWINARLMDGLTVYVASSTRLTKVSPKVAAARESAGKPVFKVSRDGRELLMLERQNYVCIIAGPVVYNRISAV
jgi:hypothetical protein